jgi:hypothetical protein
MIADTGKRPEVSRGYHALQLRRLARGTCQINQDLIKAGLPNSTRQPMPGPRTPLAQNRRPEKKAAGLNYDLTP